MTNSRKWAERALVGVLVVLVAYTVFFPNSPVPRQALAYIAPPGCPFDETGRGEGRAVHISADVPRACAVERYRLSEEEQSGLPKTKYVGRNFYRIGNDLVNLDCRREESCEAVDIYRGVYVVKSPDPRGGRSARSHNER